MSKQHLDIFRTLKTLKYTRRITVISLNWQWGNGKNLYDYFFKVLLIILINVFTFFSLAENQSKRIEEKNGLQHHQSPIHSKNSHKPNKLSWQVNQNLKKRCQTLFHITLFCWREDALLQQKRETIAPQQRQTDPQRTPNCPSFTRLKCQTERCMTKV